MALINCPECNKEISDKAGSCPNCGLPLNKLKYVESIETPHNSNTKTCPSCKSTNTQTIKMMCLSGTSSGSSTGVGISSDLDIGVGRINTNSQTALAEKFTPGKDVAEIAGMLMGFGILALILGAIMDSKLGTLASIIGGICVFIGILAFVASNDKKVKSERDAKVKLFEEGWICHTCGNTWLPLESNIASSNVSISSEIYIDKHADSNNNSQVDDKDNKISNKDKPNLLEYFLEPTNIRYGKTDPITDLFLPARDSA